MKKSLKDILREFSKYEQLKKIKTSEYEEMYSLRNEFLMLSVQDNTRAKKNKQIDKTIFIAINKQAHILKTRIVD